MSKKVKVPKVHTEIDPASFYPHFFVYTAAMKYKPKNIIDMGGTGKGAFLQKIGLVKSDCNILSANIANDFVNIASGFDCTKLTFKDNSFDVSLSVAVIEHVGGHDNILKFIDTALRICKKASIHWFPYGKSAVAVEELKKKIGHKHNCVLPSAETIDSILEKCKEGYECKFFPCLSTGVHLMSLIFRHEKFWYNRDVYEYIHKHDLSVYGYLLEITKGDSV